MRLTGLGSTAGYAMVPNREEDITNGNRLGRTALDCRVLWVRVLSASFMRGLGAWAGGLLGLVDHNGGLIDLGGIRLLWGVGGGVYGP